MDRSDEPILQKSHKPRKCEVCGGKVLPVIYGYPNHIAAHAADEGKIILGGCCIPVDPDSIEDWACRACGQRYKRALPSPSDKL